MTEIQAGESYTREGLPDEILLRVMRRADADQNKHLNLARIADSMEKFTAAIERLGDQAQRTANILDRAFPVPEEEEAVPDPVARNEAGVALPPYILNGEGGVDYDDTTPKDWGEPDDDAGAGTA
jgi:hypothetical protein